MYKEIFEAGTIPLYYC